MNELSPLCGYCGQFSVQTDGTEIYPHRPDLKKKKFYICRDCDAYVGTHQKTGKPLGTLANKELRELRKRCHAHFDLLWKEGPLTRGEAYSWMGSKLGIQRSEAHIAMFDKEQCERLLVELGERRGG